MKLFAVLLLIAMVATLAWAEEIRFPKHRPAISKRAAVVQNPTGELFKRELTEPGNEREGRHFWRHWWGPRWGMGYGWGYPGMYGYPYGLYGGFGFPYWG